MEHLLSQNVGSIINYLNNLLKSPNGELLVAVDHNELWTMASETVDPLDWPHPHTHGQFRMSGTFMVTIFTRIYFRLATILFNHCT